MIGGCLAGTVKNGPSDSAGREDLQRNLAVLFAFYFLPRHQLLTTEKGGLLQEAALYDHMQLT